MSLKILISVEKWTSLLAALLLVVGILVLPRHDSFSLAIGAGLMVLNAWLMRRVATAVGPALSAKPSLTLLLFNFKLGVLAILIYVALRWLHVAPLPFVVGVSVLPVAIVIAAIQHQLQLPHDDGGHTPHAPDESPDHRETHG